MSSQYTSKDIMLAIETSDFDTVYEILKGNTELLQLKTPLGSWLHIATDNDQFQLVKQLLKLGIDINVKGGPSGGTPINVAASEGSVTLVKYYLDHGASLDVSEPERNPLFSAIHQGNIEVVKLLLNAGIDINKKYSGLSMKNMDALAFAKEWGRTDIVDVIQDKKKLLRT